MFAVAAALLSGSAAVRAQDHGIAGYFALWSGEREQVNQRKHASCIARKYPEEARRVVVDDLPMADIIRSMPYLTKACGEGALFKENRFSIGQPVFEFMLAEALIGRLPAGTSLIGVSTVPPLTRESLPKVDLSSLSQRQRDNREVSAAMLELDAAAECVVRRDPQEAAILVRSTLNSDIEHGSAQRLAVSWAACSRSQNDTPLFIRRGEIGYNLYRLIDAAHLVRNGKDSTGA